MIYDYKCSKCSKIEEVEISTYDILNKFGIVDQDELTKRIYEDRFCECGGKLKKLFSKAQDPMFFETGSGKGKISSRFQ